MATHYEKGGVRFVQPLYTADGRQIFNPKAEQMEAEGWVLVEDKPSEPSEEVKAMQRIAELEEALRSTDYKVIKIAEAQAVGEALPYTAEEIKALRNEREAARAEINALQDKFNV